MRLPFRPALDTPNLAAYSVPDLRDLTVYAKSKGIRNRPEVDDLGHAESWASVLDLQHTIVTRTKTPDLGEPALTR
jgi:hypothetical protein